MNPATDQTVRRMDGWVLVGYTGLLAVVFTFHVGPWTWGHGWGVFVGAMAVYAIVLTAVWLAALDRLYDTGGLYVSGGDA